jgi:hypothetical protein
MLCVKCKKYKEPLYLLSNNLLCINHAKLLYNTKIIIIQKVYRGYKKRSYLRNIFNRLPRDLQINILQINSNNNNNNINNIKINRARYVHKCLYNKAYKINNFSNIRCNVVTLIELENILNFLIKHNKYINCRWKNYYTYYFKNICYIFLLILNSDNFPTTMTYIPSYISISIFNSINFLPNIENDDVYDEVNKLLQSTYVFLSC